MNRLFLLRWERENGVFVVRAQLSKLRSRDTDEMRREEDEQFLSDHVELFICYRVNRMQR